MHKRARRATHTAVPPVSRTGKGLPATPPSTGTKVQSAKVEASTGKAREATEAQSTDHASRWSEDLGGTAGPALREVGW